MIDTSLEADLAAAQAELAKGAFAQAAIRLEALERRQPLVAAIQDLLVQAYAGTSRPLDAAAARMAAYALHHAQPLLIYNLGTAYLQQAALPQAEKWLRLALQLDPGLSLAHQNLALVCREQGREPEAAWHLEQAFKTTWVFAEPARRNPSPTVLLTCAPGIGNVPLDHLLPSDRYGRLRCVIHPVLADDVAIPQLPAYDAVFNAIGDVDVVAADALPLQRILADAAPLPVRNPPARVAQTRRDRLPGLLAGLPDTLTPVVWRVEAGECLDARSAVASANLAEQLPLILRPAASHGGQGVCLLRTPEALAAARPAQAGVRYLTRFCDYRSPDRQYRKYRMFFIDRRPYAYHLAISPDWMVHWHSAGMLADPWKLAEERAFLADPEAALGPRAMRAVETIGQRLDLDFAGIDFALLPDGKVLVFEANPTMLAHPEPADGPIAYRNAAVDRIRAAFLSMLLGDAGG